MHRIEGSYHLNHFFYEGPPNTTLTADWCNAVQEEIAAVIEAANITLDTAETDSRGQLLEALQSGVIAIGIDKIGVGISPTSMTATAIETFNKTAVQFLMMEEGNNYTNIVGDANRTATDNVIMRLQANWDTTPVAYIDFVSGDDTTNQDDGYLSFSTGEGGAISERMRIEQDGNISVSGTVDGVDIAGLKTDVDGFPDELKNLVTAEIQQLENIGATTISAANWGHVNSLDQDLAQADKPQFAGATITDDIDMSSGKGLDFSADSKGVFKGINAIIWRMINSESAGSQNPLGGGGSDWEIGDDTENEYYLGSSSQVTESSGIFSFASTGYWLVMAEANGYVLTSGEQLTLYMLLTDDNSTYTDIARQGYLNRSGSAEWSPVSVKTLIKVTNTTNDKIKLRQYTSGGSSGYFFGVNNLNVTYITFIKLADL